HPGHPAPERGRRPAPGTRPRTPGRHGHGVRTTATVDVRGGPGGRASDHRGFAGGLGRHHQHGQHRVVGRYRRAEAVDPQSEVPSSARRTDRRRHRADRGPGPGPRRAPAAGPTPADPLPTGRAPIGPCPWDNGQHAERGLNVDVLTDLLAWFGDTAQWSGPSGIPTRLVEHVHYSLLALLLSVGIAMPGGLLPGATGTRGFFTVSLANIGRSLPTIGVLFLVVLAAGIGLAPVITALVILAVPPILVNTHEGVRQVEPRLKDAAIGMGMRGHEVLFRLELPVALPLILTGVRTAAVQVVATATISAYVGVGGLGRYIVDGQARQDLPMMLGGSVLVVLLAVVTTLLFSWLRRLLVAPGLRVEATSGR